MYDSRKRMQAFILLTLFLAAGFYASPVSAGDCDPQSQKEQGMMVMDTALARPVGAVATVAGFAVFLVSSPFSALGGNTHEAWDTLVAAPARYTFKRPLGHFDCERR
jgi:hypothetical protein